MDCRRLIFGDWIQLTTLPSSSPIRRSMCVSTTVGGAFLIGTHGLLWLTLFRHDEAVFRKCITSTKAFVIKWITSMKFVDVIH